MVVVGGEGEEEEQELTIHLTTLSLWLLELEVEQELITHHLPELSRYRAVIAIVLEMRSVIRRKL